MYKNKLYISNLGMDYNYKKKNYTFKKYPNLFFIGDSKAIIFGQYNYKELTTDHTPVNPFESK